MMDRTFRWRVVTAFGFGGALVSLVFACGDEAAVTTPPTPDGSLPPDAATGDAADEATVTPPPSDVEAFCQRTLGLYPSMYEECCDPVAGSRYQFDVTLLTAVPEACRVWLGKSVQSGRVTFVPTAAATCETNVSGALRARACPEVLHSPSNQPRKSILGDAAGCSEMIVGRQDVDAPCAYDYECKGGLTCIGWTEKSDGTCKTPPGDGAPCGYAIPDGGGGYLELIRWPFGNHPRCAAGFYCRSTALQQGTCVPSKPAASSCDSNDECAEGLRCQLGACGTAGPAPAGGPCERNSDCQDRLYCKSVDGGKVCAEREVAGTACRNPLGSECQGACVKPDGGSASCVAFCGSR